MNLVNIVPKDTRTPLEGGGRADVDQLIWFAQTSLNDLVAALGDHTKVPDITLKQLDDLKALVVEAQRAHSRGRCIDLPQHEFEG